MSESASGQPSVTPALQPLLGGGVVNISQGNNYAYADLFNGNQPLVSFGNPANSQYPNSPNWKVQDFTLSVQSVDSATQITVALRSAVTDGYWAAGQDAAGLQYPILLAETPTLLIISDAGGGDLAIECTSVAAGPFIHAYDKGINGILHYGYPSALIQGLFTFAVVG